MKNLILIIALFLGVTAQAQTASDVRNDESYKEMLENYTTFYSSDEHAEYMDTLGKFVQKVPEEFDFFYFKEYASNFEEWIAERIDDSGFESVEDAVTQYNILLEQEKPIRAKQVELANEMSKVREKFKDKELFNNVFREDFVNSY
ncbi:MAG TPA: hypothetical protein VKY32_02580 [Flavobacterium sp.]|nr:hypothetical protein [Flavobacterium sp.]